MEALGAAKLELKKAQEKKNEAKGALDAFVVIHAKALTKKIV